MIFIEVLWIYGFWLGGGGGRTTRTGQFSQ
jgi:hypothetical protein